jgi:hypothetical protein
MDICENDINQFKNIGILISEDTVKDGRNKP